MGTILRNAPNIHDQDTGEFVGYINPVTQQPVVARFPTGTGSLSAVTYDGSNRATSWVCNGVTFTATGWGTSSIVIAGSDGTSKTITLDGSGRITAFA